MPWIPVNPKGIEELTIEPVPCHIANRKCVPHSMPASFLVNVRYKGALCSVELFACEEPNCLVEAVRSAKEKAAYLIAEGELEALQLRH